jgi:DNA polymerase-1
VPSAAPSPRLFLIDGYALIYRAFYAMMSRPLRTTRGENTSAIWGVTNFLLKIIEEQHPSHIAWIHDSGTSHRQEQYPEYKATRQKLGEELQRDFDRSIERVEALLEALKIPLIELPGYEADDVIGTLATQAADRGIATVIVSGDKDFYQLIRTGVTLLNPGRGGAAAIEEHWVDESNASERLGVPPSRVVDYLALVGDSSDNIPGVRGVGEKTARALIEQYGDVETILAHASEVTGKRPREALLQYAAEARLSRQLVTIRCDVPIELDLDAVKVQPGDSQGLRRLFTELEFFTLLNKVEAAPAPPPSALQVVTTVDDLQRAIAETRKAGLVAMIPALSRPDAIGGTLIGLALATAEGGTWYLPFAHRPPEVATLEGDEIPENLPPLADSAMQPLREMLSDPAVPKGGHDVKRALLALRTAGITVDRVSADTMLMSFVLDPGRRSHELGSLASEFLGITLPAEAELVRQGRTTRPLAEVPVAEVARLCCEEARAVLALRDYFDPRIRDLGLAPLLERIEVPLVSVLMDMEQRGIGVDAEGLRTLSRQFGAELTAIEAEIYKEAGTEFNINSTPQLRHILFEKLLHPVIKKTKTGASTDADVLVELGEMGFAVPRLLIEYRELSKLKSTYVDALPAVINPRTGRIHTTFNQTGAATGRLSSSDPNLQNIPIRTRRGEQIRRWFVAAPGSLYVIADYSQIELRLLAHFSEDPAFIGAFERGGDVHRETAAIIFDVPVDQVTAEMRARAKTINFATIYGQGPFALSRQLSITQEQARDFIKRYFERFAGVRAFLDASIEKARGRGYAETIEGRRRYIPELKDPNFNIRAFGERTAMNSPLQGSAADLIKIAMIGVAKGIRKAALAGGMVLQVHDELIVEVPEDQVAAASEIVRSNMEGAARLRVPLVVDIGVGPNWLDAKH